jgi:hypothetical protein
VRRLCLLRDSIASPRYPLLLAAAFPSWRLLRFCVWGRIAFTLLLTDQSEALLFQFGFLSTLPHLFGYGLLVGRAAAVGLVLQRSPSIRECSHREWIYPSGRVVPARLRFDPLPTSPWTVPRSTWEGPSMVRNRRVYFSKQSIGRLNCAPPYRLPVHYIEPVHHVLCIVQGRDVSPGAR